MTGTASTDSDFGPLPAALADFPRRWREEAAPRLRSMEARRKGAIRFMIVSMAAGALVAAIVLAVGMGGEFHPLHAFGAVAALIGASAIGWTPYTRLSKDVKAALLAPAVEAAGLSFTAKGFAPARLEEARRWKLLPSYDRSAFEDRLDGAHEGMAFTLYEAKLEEKRRSDKRTYYVTVFRGLIGVAEYPSSALGTTVLARDAGWFDGLMGPKGLERAGLVDAGFERTFTAWTSDQVEARYFLTPVVMQAFLELEARFDGKKMRAAFLPGEMIFALETGNWFEAGSLFKPLDDPSRPRRLLTELGAVYHLLDTIRDCAPKKDGYGAADQDRLDQEREGLG